MNILPTQKQLEFMDWELGVFFHFGIRTFNEGHTDWDNVHMDINTFNPKKLDCEQWIKTIKKAGAKYAILTTKHHDGFANWPSAYTEYSVKNSPWKNGKGDVVKEFTDACRKYDIKVGLYYSPAQFGFSDMSGKEYDDYFINQISELLTNYGKIDYLWFDGCGSENHEYDKDRIISVIRSLQPDILIFSMWDPDTRWIGNEEGYVPLGTEYVVDTAKTSINETKSKQLSNAKFLPYECDCKIRRYNWFYSEHDEKYLRSIEDLKTLYKYSVGRGGNLLINIAPDRNGLLPDSDSKNLIAFGEYVKNKFSSPIKCSISRKKDTYTIEFDKLCCIDTIVLSENLIYGQQIKKFYIDYFYEVDMRLYNGLTVGHKQICELGTIFCDKERKLKITVVADNDYELDIKVYK